MFVRPYAVKRRDFWSGAYQTEALRAVRETPDMYARYMTLSSPRQDWRTS